MDKPVISRKWLGAAASIALVAGFAACEQKPAKLAFVTQPGGAAGGSAFASQPAVEIQDKNGKKVEKATLEVTLALGANPAGATLSGSAATAAAGGTASFAGLSIDKAGTGYTLVASAPNLQSAESAAFDVSVGAGVKLALAGAAPAESKTGETWPAIAVQILDAGGNLVTGATDPVEIKLATGTGALKGTLSQVPAGGVATFSDLSYDKAETITVDIVSGQLAGVTGTSINVAAGGKKKK